MRDEVTRCVVFLLSVVVESVWSHGNEDKNASLDLFMKTSNPTLILLAVFFF